MDRLTERNHVARGGEDRIRAALTSIGDRARTSNLRRVEILDDALTQVESGTLTGVLQEAAVCSAHQLAGSAGTFGLRPASGLASWFERFFTTLGADGQVDVAAARGQLAELRHRLDDPPDLT